MCCTNPENVHCFGTIFPNLNFVFASICAARPVHIQSDQYRSCSTVKQRRAVGAAPFIPMGSNPKTALWLWVREMTRYLYTRGMRGRMKAKQHWFKVTRELCHEWFYHVRHHVHDGHWTGEFATVSWCTPILFLIGDMNCCPKKSDTIKEFCEIYNLKNLITSPTCHKGRSPTILDIILVSQPKRFTESLNCECPLSDFHNIVGGATKQYAPFEKPRKIYYRSYKNFDDNEFIRDINNAPLHVGEIFDDIDDLSWFTSSLLIDVINEHAPVKSKILKRASVPYMNSKLRKAIYRRNMARNKFRKYGSTYWEDNHIQRNKVAAIRKASIAKYFSQKCSSHDKSFWSTFSPFMTAKRHRNGNTFMLQENGKIVIDDKLVANICNDYLCSIASQIGFDDPITTTHDIISKHKDHPSVSKIRGTYSIEANSFNISCVNEDVITSKLRSIKINKGPGYDCIPGKLIRLANEVLSPHFTYMLNQCIRLSILPSNVKNAELSPL